MDLPVLMPVFAFIATTLGLMGALIANCSRCPVSICWGRRLYLLIFLLVAASCLTMAMSWPRGVLPSCLAMAALFLAMLWHPSTPMEEGEVVGRTSR